MGKTVVHGRFEWDADKDEANKKKHGISFEEILPMFDDPLFLEGIDLEHSTEEEIRFIGIAQISGFVIVVSIYTERERTRIISARIATKKEERRYEERYKDFYA